MSTGPAVDAPPGMGEPLDQPLDEPFYVPLGDEVEIFEAAFSRRIPVLLKGPTGCGKTRFLEHMAWRLFGGRRRLVTVTCHEDLTATDLVGRYLLNTDGTLWVDGPLTQAVRGGGICYLDEVVEARKDTTVIIHSLSDYRRTLPIEKLGTVLDAHPDFLLVLSYNPGYQSSLKDLKHSTRQRFAAIGFDYPPVDVEARIVAREGGVDDATAERLAFLAERLRSLRGETALEGPGTRLLVYAAQLIGAGVAPRRAARVAIVDAVTDDPVVHDGLREVVDAILE